MPKRFSTLQSILIPLALIGFFALALITERSFSHRVHELQTDALNETEELSRLLDMAESLVGERVQTSMLLLKERGLSSGAPVVQGEVLVEGQVLPSLMFGARPQTGVFDLVDDVADIGGGTATLFVKSGDNFVRVSTNVKRVEGARAIGSILDIKGKAYAAIRHGNPFYGVVEILGEPYITGYEPMFDITGHLIGAWYVGYKVDVKSVGSGDQEMGVSRKRICGGAGSQQPYLLSVRTHPKSKGRNHTAYQCR